MTVHFPGKSEILSRRLCVVTGRDWVTLSVGSNNFYSHKPYLSVISEGRLINSYKKLKEIQYNVAG